MEYWKIGIMEIIKRNSGKKGIMESWKKGIMEYGKMGKLEYWVKRVQ